MPTALAAIDPMKLLQQYYPWLIASVIAGALLGTGAYFALRVLYPIWEAEVTYEIRPPADDPKAPVQGGGQFRDEQEAFMNTMVRVLRSDSILSKALEERRVRETVWAQKFKDASGNLNTVEALKKLRKIVSSRAILDTNIIQLRVGTHHRDDAPNIAGTISDVFLFETGSRSNRDMRDLIEQFEGVVKSLTDDIQRIDARTETLFAREKLTSLRQESTVQFNEVQNLQPALVKAREEYALTEQQLNSYKEMLNNPAGPTIPEAIRMEVERRPIVLERDGVIAGLKASIRAQRERFGPNHREVTLLQNRLAAEEIERANLVNSLMHDTFVGVVENLENSLRNQRASIEDAEERLRKAQVRLEETAKALKSYEDMALERKEKVEKKADMEKSVSELRLLLTRGSRVKVLASAQMPDELAFPRPIPTIAVAIVLVAGLTAGLIALKEVREQRIRGPHDVALIPRTRVIGVVPDMALDPSAPERMEFASRDRPQGVIAESIRQFRVALCKEMSQKGLRSVMVVGGLPGSGATSVISNLAINAAACDMRVLIIEANLRRPKIHGLFEVEGSPGLADVLLGRAQAEACIRPTAIPNISVLPCGSRETPVFERFTSQAMHTMFQDLKQKFDLMIVDSTPGVVAGDAVALAAHCDGVVLVVRAMQEKRGLVARLRNQFAETGAEFLGVVVNGVKPSAGGYFKRNFQVTHDYGREGAPAGKGADASGRAGDKGATSASS